MSSCQVFPVHKCPATSYKHKKLPSSAPRNEYKTNKPCHKCPSTRLTHSRLHRGLCDGRRLGSGHPVEYVQRLAQSGIYTQFKVSAAVSCPFSHTRRTLACARSHVATRAPRRCKTSAWDHIDAYLRRKKGYIGACLHLVQRCVFSSGTASNSTT